jgi:hypothetical protein
MSSPSSASQTMLPPKRLRCPCLAVHQELKRAAMGANALLSWFPLRLGLHPHILPLGGGGLACLAPLASHVVVYVHSPRTITVQSPRKRNAVWPAIEFSTPHGRGYAMSPGGTPRRSPTSACRPVSFQRCTPILPASAISEAPAVAAFDPYGSGGRAHASALRISFCSPYRLRWG